jgi:hypothetical protein
MPPTPEQRSGRLGMLYVQRQALLAGCTPIEYPSDLDTGIDGLLEFADRSGPRLLALQVKHGRSFFDARGARCQVDAEHLRAWAAYAVPVALVVVSADDDSALCINVTQYVREHPSVLELGTHTLRPTQPFDAKSLRGAVAMWAIRSGVGEVLGALLSADPEARRASLSLLYPFRSDRRAVFCLAAAIREEPDRHVMRHMCDFYSRYLPHPEVSFDVGADLRRYAASVLSESPRSAIVTMLAAFGDDDEVGDWSGMEEIYGITEEEIWDRHSIVNRGTPQQGIAEVIAVSASPARLLALITDDDVEISERRAAAGLFGYLGTRAAWTRWMPFVKRSTMAR